MSLEASSQPLLLALTLHVLESLKCTSELCDCTHEEPDTEVQSKTWRTAEI